jgi:hypothetical protein
MTDKQIQEEFMNIVKLMQSLNIDFPVQFKLTLHICESRNRDGSKITITPYISHSRAKEFAPDPEEYMKGKYWYERINYFVDATEEFQIKSF